MPISNRYVFTEVFHHCLGCWKFHKVNRGLQKDSAHRSENPDVFSFTQLSSSLMQELISRKISRLSLLLWKLRLPWVRQQCQIIITLSCPNWSCAENHSGDNNRYVWKFSLPPPRLLQLIVKSNDKRLLKKRC